ncbi:glycerol-1-phosphate dehydrogenase [NAD(P)+] [Paenibacillus baekrokdamisoli]|uniref:Glycerol-1-phosphate dehydrogenase [NAD(P)+] n=2 Tax=Paenibacillus baekrokdamisoli TaxID=1712516 RepID=A0A3G9J109_9BACL|nr:sn-glycerol-1-phosphate dehydrogenase [Paenibacillus baekrokdamisoli]MBB3072277.1 glycerol-1-phosphate dehydrogenase [NAD(P)+] [Paenibacillus baekrokdamisoli]BBH24860.1 glycerol-1-phosphate dehydrogenase [NAD(P)+] [Paenibacillus baekrokdamisoli]
MTHFMDSIQQAASRIEGLDPDLLAIGPVLLEHGAVQQVAPYLKDQDYGHVAIVADARTYDIAGQALESSIQELGVAVQVTIIDPDHQGDVIADEASIIQLILALKTHSSEVVVAVGTGTLHDIVRFSAYTLNIPFVSVPTAPSVDGFNSKGAPIILRGEKKTITAIGPNAIFADLDILTKAPAALVAAGFGDMLGKYTSLFDWKFGHLAGGEPYSEVVAEMTRNALQQCVDHSDEIAKRSSEGIRLLMGALLESGFAMLLFGQSHPASGAEHHLSHYWEMEFLRLGSRQILHGAKVGVACAEISRLYHQLADDSLVPVAPALLQAIRDEISLIPDEQTIRQLLRTVGGATTPEELGVKPELLTRSLNEAHLVRPNRYTLLRAYNEAK